MLEAILIDMDGTLIDSEPYWIAAETVLTKKFNVLWTQEMGEKLKGVGMEKSIILFQKLGVKMSANEIVDYFNKKMVEQVNLKAVFRNGVINFLIKAKNANLKIALVTSSYSEYVNVVCEKVYKKAKCKLFDAIVTADIVKNDKPAPDPYLLGAKKLRIPIENCIGFEDSKTGATSVKNAGAKLGFYSNTGDFENIKSDFYVKNWSNVLIGDLQKLWT